MKFNTDKLTLGNNGDKRGVFIEVPLNLLDKLKKIVDKEGMKSVEIKTERKSRSLNSNAYFWTLVNKIAVAMKSTDDEIYIDMLHKYGTKEYVACLPDIIPELKKAFKIVETVSKTVINGKWGVTLRLIRGSSTYDTKEMSTLIEGIVDEAKILQIETLSPKDLKIMNDSWEGQ